MRHEPDRESVSNSGFFSDASCDFCTSGGGAIADDVRLSAVVAVGHIKLFGGYLLSNSPVALDDFRVRILNDDSSLPGTTVYYDSDTDGGLSWTRNATQR